MRVIAGDFKGRKLVAPPGKLVRPTAEKVKGAIFSMIQDRVPGSLCCDLFAGTGALGLEALSRGAEYCYFGDHAQESITVLRENIAHCQAEERAHVTHGDYRKTLSRLPQPVDLFFLDPPYHKGLMEAAITDIWEGKHLASNGVIIAEHGADHQAPEALAGLAKVKEKTYGIVVISIYM